MSQLSPARQGKHFSHSACGSFQACPKAHFLKKVAKVDQLPSMASVAGRAAHALTELWDKAGNPEWDFTRWAEEAHEMLADEISHMESESGLAHTEWRVSGRATKEWSNKENREWWEAKLPGMGMSYANWRRDNPQFEIWITPDGEEAIELELVVDIPGCDVPFLAYIDRVLVDTTTGALIILDLKFGSMNPEDLSQLARYAMALEIRYGVRAEFGAIYKGRTGTLIPIFKDDKVLMSLAHLPTSVVASGLADAYALMTSGRYPANPGKHCGWCDVRNSCTWAKGKDAWKHDPAHPAYQGQLDLAA